MTAKTLLATALLAGLASTLQAQDSTYFPLASWEVEGEERDGKTRGVITLERDGKGQKRVTRTFVRGGSPVQVERSTKFQQQRYGSFGAKFAPRQGATQALSILGGDGPAETAAKRRASYSATSPLICERLFEGRSFSGASVGHKETRSPTWLNKLRHRLDEITPHADGSEFEEAAEGTLPERVASDAAKTPGTVLRSRGEGLPLVLLADSGLISIYSAGGSLLTSGEQGESGLDWADSLTKAREKQEAAQGRWSVAPRFTHTNAILDALAQATEDVYVLSEGDEPFDYFFRSNKELQDADMDVKQNGVQRADVAVKLLGRPQGHPVELAGDSVAKWLEDRLWKDVPDEVPSSLLEKPIVAAFTRHLRHIRIFRVAPADYEGETANEDEIGDIGEIEIYILGVNKFGDVVGLKTIIVET